MGDGDGDGDGDQVEEEEQGKRDEPSDNTVGHANVEHRVFHLKKEIYGNDNDYFVDMGCSKEAYLMIFV